MKKTLRLEVTQPTIISITDIAYSYVPYWNGFKPLKMSLLLPKFRENIAPRPFIIWICGGGFDTMDKDVWLPEMLFYARNGYTVASIEYRTQNVAVFPALLEDVKAAARFLRAHSEEFAIDKEKGAVMGESAGAYLATLAAVSGNTREFDKGKNLSESSEFQAAVNIYGRSDMVRGWYEKRDQGRKRNGTELLLSGKPDEIPELYEKASPVCYIRKGLPPFLLLHGSNDKMVPQIQNDLFYEKLIESGNEADYYIIEDAGHGADEFYQPEIKKIVLEFLDKHLK